MLSQRCCQGQPWPVAGPSWSRLTLASSNIGEASSSFSWKPPCRSPTTKTMTHKSNMLPYHPCLKILSVKKTVTLMTHEVNLCCNVSYFQLAWRYLLIFFFTLNFMPREAPWKNISKYLYIMYQSVKI